MLKKISKFFSNYKAHSNNQVANIDHNFANLSSAIENIHQQIETSGKDNNYNYARLQYFLTELKNRYYLSIYDNKKWMQDIIDIQDQISDGDVNDYYRSNYRREEVLYWINIPRWAHQLKDQNKHIDTILDIGCGYGTLVAFFKKTFNSSLVCIDFTNNYFPNFLKEDIEFYVKNVELDALNFQKKFDIVLLTEVIEHFNFSAVTTLKKIKKNMNPGGKFFLSTPDSLEWGKVTKYYSSYNQLPKPSRNNTVIDDHVWQFSKEELLNVLLKSGFKIEKIGYSPGIFGRHINVQCTV